MENMLNSKRTQNGTDLFELLRSVLSCQYISDLRVDPYNAKARRLLEHLDLRGYSSNHVSDLYKYLGISF